MRFNHAVSLAAFAVATSLTQGISTLQASTTPTTQSQPVAAPRGWDKVETSVETPTPEVASPTVEPAPATLAKVDDSYTKEGLLTVAAERGITVKKSWKKQQIIDAINA